MCNLPIRTDGDACFGIMIIRYVDDNDHEVIVTHGNGANRVLKFLA